ncbi:MAG: GNAT family N-acetyltransferase [Beijerinckiaceae bacterium]|nr:GNAT family N-acetyltransferase [Beijerinckiaceae bacterium]MCZ8300872.1 GNAT family N-acetyltransferase [Beijerinckiaceae bacterium]
MPDYLIRLYATQDREAAIGLIDELNNHEAEMGARRRTDRIAAIDCVDDDTRKAAADGGQIVLEAEGRVVGYCAYRHTKAPPFLPGAFSPEIYVENLVVAQAARGKGYGQALLKAIEDIAREAGATRIVLGVVPGNTLALKAYERAGFSPIAVEMERLVRPASEKPA